MNKADELLKIVNEEIVSAYLVGGSVRDLVRGVEPKDYDFATPVHVDEVEARIKASGRRAYQIGNSKRHGTVGCKIDGQPVEITTFRTERYVEGSRQPIVEFVDDLNLDLSRRDFTMNAMALGIDGFHDPFQGADDVRHSWIMPVGDPVERFTEDPLRMLRAVRFQSTLGFDIDDTIRLAILSERSKLLTISKERWVSEIDRILMGANVRKALTSMRYLDLFSPMLPELHFRYKALDGFSVSSDDLNGQWSSLLSNLFIPHSIQPEHERLFRKDMMRKFAAHLRFSNERLTYLLDHC